MKRKYYINEKGKERIILMIWFLAMVLIVWLGTMLYLERLDKIQNGQMTIQCDCDLDK